MCPDGFTLVSESGKVCGFLGGKGGEREQLVPSLPIKAEVHSSGISDSPTRTSILEALVGTEVRACGVV